MEVVTLTDSMEMGLEDVSLGPSTQLHSEGAGVGLGGGAAGFSVGDQFGLRSLRGKLFFWDPWEGVGIGWVPSLERLNAHPPCPPPSWGSGAINERLRTELCGVDDFLKLGPTRKSPFPPLSQSFLITAEEPQDLSVPAPPWLCSPQSLLSLLQGHLVQITLNPVQLETPSATSSDSPENPVNGEGCFSKLPGLKVKITRASGHGVLGLELGN